MKTYRGKIVKLEPNQIFVFGSNTQGRHGKGAALWALQNAGAKYGQAKGLQGQSYAIVTKDLTKPKHPSISAGSIVDQIADLYKIATDNPRREFLIAYSGNGINLNGYTPLEMAAMFAFAGRIPDNVVFEYEFYRLIMIKILEIN